MGIISTILFYFQLIFISAWLSKTKTSFFLKVNDRFYFKITGFHVVGLILILVSGLRYDVGTDYLSYIASIEWFNKNDIYYSKSICSYFIGKIIYKNNLGYHWYFLITSGITIIFLFKALKDSLGKEKYLGVLIFMVSGFYFYTFNAVRATLAIAVLMYSIKFIKSKEFFKYCIAVLFASSWHWVSLIFLPIYFVANKNIDYYLLILWFVVLLPTNIITKFINQLIKFSQNNYLTIYLISKQNNVTEGSPPLGIFVIIIISIFIFLTYQKTNKERKNEIRIFFNLYFFGVIVFFMSYKIPILIRFSDFFYPFQMFCIPLATKSMEKKTRIIFILCLIFVYSFFMLNEFYDELRNYTPYQTIFSNS